MCVCVCVCVCVCLYNLVLKITKGTWEKCGIKTGKYYNEKEDIIDSWNKVSDFKIQLRHSNIYRIALE